MPDTILRLTDVSKTYPGVTALSHVSLSLEGGQVLGLIGENGAGKSTLMKILGGVVAPSSGSIVIDGLAHDSLTVASATAAGVAFVHQELNLFDNLDAAANILIGREPVFGGALKLIDRGAIAARAQALLTRLGTDFKASALVGDLSLAQRQLVEIAKALSLDARILILDEPTSSLTVRETARLLDVVASLKAQGVGIVFISHRLNEIEQCADRVVVLRDGRVVGELARADIRHDRMIGLMIGRDLKSLYEPPTAPPGAAALGLRDVRTPSRPDKSVSLDVRRGEILGLAGLVGSGRTELARAVFGIDAMVAGRVELEGAPVTIDTPRAAIDRGIYLVPEDRKRSGLLLDVSVTQNVTLASLARYASAGLLRPGDETASAEAQRQALGIKVPTVAAEVGTLSGGNQQKVVLAKWLSMSPRVIIFDEPTRGIDVGAKKEIYELMRRLADSGVAILMISSDMEEVIGVCDRMAVMHEGAISGFLGRADFSERNVLRLAVGQPLNTAAALG